MDSKLINDLSKFKVLNKINAGSFGSVCLVQDQVTKEKYAAKIIFSILNDDSNRQKTIDREIGILINHQHPNIIKLYGYSLNDFDGNGNITILMNYAENGSLLDILNQARKGLAISSYDNTLKQKILIGIARGMMYLHKNKIIHRDLKPGNILFDDKFNVLIADLGLSKIYDPSKSETQTQSCGTSIYMSPEVIDGRHYDEKVDVYSFAIIMYEILTESIPYPEFHEGKISLYRFNSKVINENYRPTFNVPIKESHRSMIEKCWSGNPNERPSFEEIFNKLAFNRNSEFDIIEPSDQDYYIQDIDTDELLSYIDVIFEKEGNTEENIYTNIPTAHDINPEPKVQDQDKAQNNSPQNDQANKDMNDHQTGPRVKIQENETQKNDLSFFRSNRKKRKI